MTFLQEDIRKQKKGQNEWLDTAAWLLCLHDDLDVDVGRKARPYSTAAAEATRKHLKDAEMQSTLAEFESMLARVRWEVEVHEKRDDEARAHQVAKATARARRLAELRNDLLVFRAQQARLGQSREAAYNDSVMDEGNEAPKNPFVVVHWT